MPPKPENLFADFFFKTKNQRTRHYHDRHAQRHRCRSNTNDEPRKGLFAPGGDFARYEIFELQERRSVFMNKMRARR